MAWLAALPLSHFHFVGLACLCVSSVCLCVCVCGGGGEKGQRMPLKEGDTDRLTRKHKDRQTDGERPTRRPHDPPYIRWVVPARDST